ncbi:sigma-54-dependent Fis family transcriptional regulator [Geomonas silvestris]|uniref:Sigma-54-dependent Fis family transcriptional regulator n=1 Tax=Geomonas silvestris TaxID=2740184 RepID=A0A6V8MDK7_9BACT|nr:sigma-54-dependent Fis family transcriptional regulator [Geomonas silvestris]GFO57883.1 sigma-54-dependent Fis family transcriptional regulator [Geomonas silvestris]
MKTSDLDFRELLSFNPKGGVIRFLGQRVYLMDAAAQSLLRKDLLEVLGPETFRIIFTRASYAHGWRLAQTVEKEMPEAWAEAKQGELGPLLSAWHGIGEIVGRRRTDGLGDEPLVETIMKDSYEAEQHLMLSGLSKEAVCWRHAAFASGYVSYLEGREVYFIEDKCIAKGDEFCRIRGKFREQWGPELEPYLPYYQMKPVESICDDLRRKLLGTEKRLRNYRHDLGYLRNECEGSHYYSISRSVAMQKVLEFASLVSEVDSSVLITGESGVGKEQMALQVHRQSRRAKKPFLAVNCGALSETLLDSELFGHVKGAFTGADRDRVGLFEAAAGGTLFLDEVGEVSSAMQVKLLRTLQEREIRRIGENASRKIDVRIISATNRKLSEAVASGSFRQDLYYRLKVIELKIPPLRERTEDILPLARFILAPLAKGMHKRVTGFTHKAADKLLGYLWPGNIRELQNAIEYAVVLCRGNQVELEDLPPEVREATFRPSTAFGIRSLESVEREYIQSVLHALGDNKARTAEQLGISLATLYRKLKLESP